MKIIEICMVCRKDIAGTKYAVVKEDGDTLFYHEPCMPPKVREHVARAAAGPRPAFLDHGPLPV